MAEYDLGALLDYERTPGEVWIRVTPGRLRAFLARYVDQTDLAPQSRGAADMFLKLLRDAEKALKRGYWSSLF
jgi:hypothetical protein